ncbi:PIN2/TERF1-interacting telomerase inhibitor 1 [Nymphon striatum]|nr:PIN2/TERF1-interacting telomerase inhibitor 1 [Nymphon striatum]
MSKAKKRRADHGCNLEELQMPPPVCILHVSGMQHGEFIPLHNIRGPPQEKLEMLHNLHEKRLFQSHDSPARMEAVCRLIPDNLDDVDLERTGYHRGCYQAFTKHQNRLKCVLPDDEPQLFDPLVNHQPLPRTFFHQNVFSVKSLRQKFLEGLNVVSTNRSIDNKQDKNLEAHQSSFNVVLDFIRERVIGQKEVVQLGTLRHLYVQELERCGFPNPDFRSDKLKTRLERHTINECIAITKVFSGDRGCPGGCIAYNLVYSTSISVAEAVTCAYRIGSKDKFEDVALHLGSVVQGMFNESTPLPWPPIADELDARASEEYLPTDLVKFLSTLILGEAEVEKSEKSQRLVLSTTFAFNIFGTTPLVLQLVSSFSAFYHENYFLSKIRLFFSLDICRAVTNGEWKLPKHILLCSTIRHLYRSNQLTNILHRLGHWESYYFGLEVETALAEAIDDVSSSLIPQITTGEDNEVFHVEWDNLNKITTNVHGSNMVNSTGGIMIQEVKPNTDIADKDRTLPLKQRNKTRCLGDGTPLTMPHLHIYGRRIGPKFPTGAKFSPPIKNDKLYSECIRKYHLWCLMRMATSSKETQLVPGFGGFISATGKKPSRKSTIDYFNPINQPFTEYSVIRELLKRSEDATLEFPEEYKKHVITPGPFHTVMNYIGMLTGHKCMGSGYSEILLEAGLVTSGCLKSVLKRKVYAKDLFSLKTVSEAMERLLIECFSEEEDINVTNPVALLNAAQNCSRESLDHALHDPSTAHISRVNHRLAIYKRADIPIFWSPKPYNPEQGWERNDEGVLEPVWSCGPVLPPTMIDLVEKTTEEMEQCDDDIEEEQSEQDSDYEELLNEDKYGQKMLEKMGWSKGKGLGKNEDGIVENLKVKLKDDNTGVGYTDDNWNAHQDEFSAFLKNLNDKHKSAVPTQKKNIPNSLEMRSKLSQKRVHYQKFVRGKDTSQYSASDISSILGKRPATDCSKDISESEISSVISKKEDNMIISSVNVNDYFKQKQQKSNIHHENSKHDSLENINGSMNNKTSNEETIDESNEYVFQTSTNNVSDYLKQKMKDLKEKTKKYVSKTRISSEDDKVNAELSQVDSAIKSTNTGVVLRCDKNKMQISKLRSRDQKIKNDYLEASSETISLKKSKKKKKKRNCHLETDTNYGLTYKVCTPILNVKCFNYLEIHLTTRLSSTPHIDFVISKCAARIGYLRSRIPLKDLLFSTVFKLFYAYIIRAIPS